MSLNSASRRWKNVSTTPPLCSPSGRVGTSLSPFEGTDHSQPSDGTNSLYHEALDISIHSDAFL